MERYCGVAWSDQATGRQTGATERPGVICALASGADRLSPQPLYPRSDKSRPINSSDQTAAPAAVAE